MRAILSDHPQGPSLIRAEAARMTYRVETIERTEPRGMFSPSRCHPFHSQTGQEVKERSDPPTVIVTLSVSCDPQEGHEFRAMGAMTPMSSA
jgi:hypothetical protein